MDFKLEFGFEGTQKLSNFFAPPQTRIGFFNSMNFNYFTNRNHFDIKKKFFFCFNELMEFQIFKSEMMLINETSFGVDLTIMTGSILKC